MPKQKPEETRAALIEKRKNYKPRPAQRGKKTAGPGTWNNLYELLATRHSLGFEETNKELGRRGYGHVSEEDYTLRRDVMRYAAYALISEDYNVRLGKGVEFKEILTEPINGFGENFVAMFVNAFIQDHRFSTIDAVNMLIEEYGLLPPTNELEDMFPIRMILRECLKAIRTNYTTGIPDEIWETMLSLPEGDLKLARKYNVSIERS